MSQHYWKRHQLGCLIAGIAELIPWSPAPIREASSSPALASFDLSTPLDMSLACPLIKTEIVQFGLRP